jgi:hypothetical protein
LHLSAPLDERSQKGFEPLPLLPRERPVHRLLEGRIERIAGHALVGLPAGGGSLVWPERDLGSVVKADFLEPGGLRVAQEVAFVEAEKGVLPRSGADGTDAPNEVEHRGCVEAAIARLGLGIGKAVDRLEDREPSPRSKDAEELPEGGLLVPEVDQDGPGS